MSSGAITIIVPFRDQAPLLWQACRSLQQQSRSDWNALLVNDSSQTEAVSVANYIRKSDQRFQLLHLSRSNHFPGPWLARNHGLKAATTNLVAFLDADDLWHPRKLEAQLRLHETNDHLLSVCGYYRFKSSDLSLREVRQPPKKIDRATFLNGNPIPLSSVIVQRDLLLEAGGFRPEKHEDYGLWLRLFLSDQPPSYRCLEEVLMAYRLHGQSISAARHQSFIAVDALLRQHYPRRRQRWPILVGRWGTTRLTSALFSRIWKASHTMTLPEPFLTLAQDSSGSHQLFKLMN
jgi:hypothetical protein